MLIRGQAASVEEEAELVLLFQAWDACLVWDFTQLVYVIYL